MSLFSPQLGIDLGTTSTLVYIPDRGVVLNEPTVVALSEDGREVLAVGLEAKEMIGRTPESIRAHRPLKDGVVADYRTTEIMLAYYLKKALGSRRFLRPEVIVSVPASVTSTERRAVLEAAERAGARRVYVVKEPILAAIGAGVPIHEPRGHIIVDIGGGTTDVAVISLGGIVASASVKCAGNRLDAAIGNFVKKEHGLRIGEQTAEEVKIAIGSARAMKKDQLEAEVRGSDILTGLPRTIALRTNELAKAIQPELKEMVQAIARVLQDTPPELARDIIENGIILSGGTAQLRDFPELIFEKTGVKAVRAEEANLCVARGTGLALRHLATYKRALLAK